MILQCEALAFGAKTVICLERCILPDGGTGCETGKGSTFSIGQRCVRNAHKARTRAQLLVSEAQIHVLDGDQRIVVIFEVSLTQKVINTIYHPLHSIPARAAEQGRAARAWFIHRE